MPPKVRITKEDIVTASVNMVREQSVEVLNARAIAAHMGCSTQPIFSNYASMDELKQDVMQQAYNLYLHFLEKEAENNQYPKYKASGMGYIRFAKEEKELFKLLFMRDRSNESMNDDFDDFTQAIIQGLGKSLGLSYENAKRYHLQMWIYVHGIATMMATSYLSLEWDDISALITDVYEGMKKQYVKEEK